MTKKVALRIFISFFLLSLLLFLLNKEKLLDIIKSCKVEFLFIAYILYLTTQVISSIRWNFLIRAKDIKIPFKKVISFYFVGMFFNLFLPTAVGGDVVKVYDLYRYSKEGKNSFATVFVDRLSGLFALMAIFLVSYVTFGKMDLGRDIDTIFFVSLVFLGSPILLIFKGPYELFCSIQKRFKDKAFLAKPLSLLDAIISYRERSGAFFLAFFLSTVLQMINVCVYYIIGISLGADIAFRYFLLFVPIVAIVSVLPISLAGLGVREGTMIYLFSRIGVSKELSFSISFIWFLINAFASIFGGVILINRIHKGIGGKSKISF